MALPGQTFKRVLMLLLDCGHSMQQPFHHLPGGGPHFKGHPSLVRSTNENEAQATHAAFVSNAAAPGALAAVATTATTPLALMEACVLRYLENLAVSSARVDVAVIAYGSPNTKNHLAPSGEESTGYLHVEELLEPRSISWQAARVVEQHLRQVKHSKTANRSDWIDAVVVGADLLERTYGGKLLQHEVFFLLFSDFKSPPSSEEDLAPVQEHLKKLDVQLISVLITRPDVALPPVLLPGTELPQQSQPVQRTTHPPHGLQQQRHTQQQGQQHQQLQPSQQQQHEQQQGMQYVEREHRGLVSLWGCAAAVVPWSSFCSSAALRFPSLLRSRRLTTKCRVPLKISSSFSLPVFVFLQTKRESLPPLRKRVFLSNNSTAAAAGGGGARAAGGEKRRRRSSGDEDAGEDEGEAPEAVAATKGKWWRKEASTRGGEDGLDEGEPAAAGGADGWKDVCVQRFYYRAQDPDRRPVLLATECGHRLFPPTAAPRERAGAPTGAATARQSGVEGKDDDAAAVTIKDEEKEEKTLSQLRHKLLGYRFGKDLVVISPLEQQALKQSRRPAAIEALGVVKQARIKRWWITGNSEYVTSAFNCLGALLALRALVLALQRLCAALICSVTWREGQPARPAVLLPHTYLMPQLHRAGGDAALKKNADGGNEEQRRCYGFYLVYLPCAEDMQMLRLPSLRSVSPAQLQAVESFVTLLTFPSPVGAAASAASPAPPPCTTRAATSGADAAAAAEGSAEGGRQHLQQPATAEGLSAARQEAAVASSFSCADVLLERRVSSNSRSNKGSSSSMYASLPNPAVEIWERYQAAASPSPPCTSSLYRTFLPPGISSFSSLREYADVQLIPSPALERFCALLVYRYHNPVTPLFVRGLGAASKGGISSRHSSRSLETQEQRSSPLQQKLLFLLWPPQYCSTTYSFSACPAALSSPEGLFCWGVRPPREGGEENSLEAAAAATATAARENAKGERDTGVGGEHPQEAAKEALFAAFPLGTCAAAQQSSKERRAAGKQQLWSDVQQKQRHLQAPVERLLLKDVRLPPEADEHDEAGGRGAAAGKGAKAGAKATAAATAQKAAAGEQGEGEAAERAAERDARKERIALLEKLHVRSINPVGDFNRMLEVRETDLTEKAIEEMIAVIHRFLEAAKRRDVAESHQGVAAPEDAGRQQLLGKAFACVTALREGCRRELEGARFNRFLRCIKAEAHAEERRRETAGAAPHTDDAAPETGATATQKGRGADVAAGDAGKKSAAGDGERAAGNTTVSAILTFYTWLKEAKVPLITTAEDPRAGVKPKESLSIYSEASAADEEQQLVAKKETPSAELSAEEQELLDLIE